MAPEIIQEKPYDHKVDIWSIGIITYILLSGRPPFAGRTKKDIFNAILTGQLRFDHPIWAQVSDDAKDFIRKALIKDPASRADAKTLLEHQWLVK
jgi:serine/threonine protein kinase